MAMALIFISALMTYYRNKQALQEEKYKVIEKSELKYRTLVESLEDAILVISVHDTVAYFNDKFCQIFNTGNNISEQDLESIFPQEILSEFSSILAQVRTSKQAYKTELTYQYGNHRYWFDLSCIPQGSGSTGSVLCIFHDFTKRKELENELQEAIGELNIQKQRLEGLSTEVIRAQEDERKRISRDLHDDIGQTLTAISFNLEHVNQYHGYEIDEFKRKLTVVNNLVGKSISEIHRFAHDLRPTVLDNLGFDAAVRSYVDKFSQMTNIRCRLELSADTEKLEDYKQIVLYRVIQESMNNIAKHAQASETILELSNDRKGIILTLSDNGIGFNIQQINQDNLGIGGLGIMGIKERMKLVGGKLSLISNPGEGTTIIVKVPLQTEN